MNKLIKDAEESGFKSYRFSVEQRLKEFGSDITFYLWMCEFHKWLRDTHNIHIYIVPVGNNEGWTLANIRRLDLDLLADKIDIGAKLEKHKTYEQALEKGLIEALKLLK